MDSANVENGPQQHERESAGEREKSVLIEVDNHSKEIRPGSYVVSKLKEIAGVPAEKDLDQVIDGSLTPLDDAATVVIRGGEVFFSHVRRGGSS